MLMDKERADKQRLEALQQIMDELSRPDLTIARANAIRPQLEVLLGMKETTRRRDAGSDLLPPRPNDGGRLFARCDPSLAFGYECVDFPD